MTGYPIQPAKVQRPPLRDETLARDGCSTGSPRRSTTGVILLLADAGYGKTTLLADFSRRTRVRTLWYRLDDDDRDWMSFLRHLVAAGPGARSRSSRRDTAALLQRPGHGRADPRDRDSTCSCRELPAIAERGAVLILDDFHLVDESPDVRHDRPRALARGAGAPVVRVRQPARAARCRWRACARSARSPSSARTTCRFDATETARLFTETYGARPRTGRPRRVADRTEGWAASLQLVQAALRDRSPAEIRAFVRGLTGADQELYDYLAEEVVGDLPEDLQQFLMRTSILQVVTPGAGARSSPGSTTSTSSRLTAAAERLTLLSRISGGAEGRSSATTRSSASSSKRGCGHRSGARPSPSSIGGSPTPPRDSTGASPPTTTARPATRPPSLAVVSGAIPTILGNGQYALAEGFIRTIHARPIAPELRPDPEPRRHAARRLRSRDRGLAGRAGRGDHRAAPSETTRS